MNSEERRRLAQQLEANPLYDILMDEIEQNAIERMVSAQTDMERMEAQAYVRATRSFREDCEAMARNTQDRKGAPA